jgi:hypothetical protein
MSGDLEVLLNDLIMKAERTTAEFRHEVHNAQRIETALIRMRQLNAMAFNEALALMQELPQPVIEQPQPMPQFLNRALAN